MQENMIERWHPALLHAGPIVKEGVRISIALSASVLVIPSLSRSQPPTAHCRMFFDKPHSRIDAMSCSESSKIANFKGPDFPLAAAAESGVFFFLSCPAKPNLRECVSNHLTISSPRRLGSMSGVSSTTALARRAPPTFSSERSKWAFMSAMCLHVDDNTITAPVASTIRESCLMQRTSSPYMPSSSNTASPSSIGHPVITFEVRSTPSTSRNITLP
mmetsp:Transcript_5531/g.10969  ORF Transcript_5531/g.10969 Transcript_5531/m.10969 type:complete len:217 (-) Transcript_5531:201-851(-)